MSGTATFNPADCVFHVFSRDCNEPLKRFRVVVELRSAQETREKEKKVKAAAKATKIASGEKYDEDEFWEEDEHVENSYLTGIGYMTGHFIYRRRCRGDFLGVMDDESRELHEVSVKLFDQNGMVKPEFTQSEWHKGTGCFGSDLNNGTLIYIDTVEVDQAYRRQGVATWILQQFLQSQHVGRDDPVIAWPIAINDHRQMTVAQKEEESRQIVSLFQKNNFRRIGRTVFFAYSKNPDHPSRRLSVSDDAEYENQDTSTNENDDVPPMMRDRDSSRYNVDQFPVHREIAASSPLLPAYARPLGRMPIDQFLAAVCANSLALVHTQDDEGMTPLHVAAGLLNELAVKTLVKPEIAGTHADWSRRDNVKSQTPLEIVEFAMRNHSEFLQTMLHKYEPYPDYGLRCAYALRKAAGENVGTEVEYFKTKQWGCTCGRCFEGWFSPRMRYRMKCESLDVWDMLPYSLPIFERDVRADPLSVSVSMGLDHIPPALRGKINRSFANGFRAVVSAIATACSEEELAPHVDKVRALSGNDAVYYFQMGGRAEYVLDFITYWMKDMSPLGDGTWDEGMDELAEEEDGSDWEKLPHCAHDLDFGLLRHCMGLPAGRMGPYLDEIEEDDDEEM